MARKRIHATGAVAVTDEYTGGSSVPPTVVGSAPQWDDDSDGTYSEQETFEHPDVSYADTAITTLQRGVATSKNPALVTVTAMIRYQCLSVDMIPPNCTVQYSGVVGSLLFGQPPSGMAGSLAPTWLELTMQETSAGRMQTFLDRVNDSAGTLELKIQPGFLRTYSFRYPRTRIYEAYLVVQTVSGAPPCRIFPRSDGLGVGAGRNYPPPKSQQGSSRGVGFY